MVLTHWCRRRGCKRTRKNFDLMRIRAQSFKILAKSLKTFTNSLKIWANSLKIWAKMAPNMLWFEKMVPKTTRRAVFLEFSFFWVSSRASLGVFGQKSWAPPKICLLLHLFTHFSAVSSNAETSGKCHLSTAWWND